MVEEQALCRVHRVGQKRNVTTVRYLIRDSFEEVSRPLIFILYNLSRQSVGLANVPQQVVKLQKRKRDLAEATFGHSLLSEDGIGLGTLEVCWIILLRA